MTFSQMIPVVFAHYGVVWINSTEEYVLYMFCSDRKLTSKF